MINKVFIDALKRSYECPDPETKPIPIAHKEPGCGLNFYGSPIIWNHFDIFKPYLTYINNEDLFYVKNGYGFMLERENEVIDLLKKNCSRIVMQMQGGEILQTKWFVEGPLNFEGQCYELEK